MNQKRFPEEFKIEAVRQIVCIDPVKTAQMLSL